MADETLSPERSLEVIEQERADVRRKLSASVGVLNGMWAGLWFVSFLAFHLAGRGWPGPVIPYWVAGVITAVAIVAGVVVSAVLGVRSGRGLRGPSVLSGALYGWSWTLSYGALVAVNLMLQSNGLPKDLVPVLWSGTTMTLAGALCLAGGAMFRDIAFYAVGVVFLASAVVSVLVGMDYQALVLAVAGLLGFGSRAVVSVRRG
ncbi:hypothetical protein [Amycolatopsis suaedae]|uniref:Uncharacterized protein n=1 Tax=Amycolatopsis suaedae TaxID=2510978 RepID=A0A4Q7IZJ2_9PSEU|nr:hypothetical protein [Amycolatopsis suaedae]RZQ60471.1 hypothetical protein EWH70_29725 [Amycolatopsis suaedae]